MSFLCWGLQSWTQDSRWGVSRERSKGAESPPSPTAHAALDAAQDTGGFLGCQRALPAHVELLSHQHPQELLLRAALEPPSAQPVLVLAIALTHGQDLALGLVEPHAVHAGPPLQ